MIDWIDAVLPLRHIKEIRGGAVVFENEDGVPEKRVVRFRLLKGSYEATSTIRTRWERPGDFDGEAFRYVRVSGNPAKWFQGHNCFGSDALVCLCASWAIELCQAVGVEVDAFTRERWMRGDFKLNRVDVAQMLACDDEAEKLAVMRTAGQVATFRNRGRGVYDDGTVRWGCRSTRRDVVKLYDKSAELSRGGKHGLPKCLPMRDELMEWCRPMIRAEVEFHAKHLDQAGLRWGHQWDAFAPQAEWEKSMKRIELPLNAPLPPLLLRNAVAALPKRRGNEVLKTYFAWESGHDVRQSMSRAQAYKHRSFFAPLGIDIFVPCPRERVAVVSLAKVIRPQISSVPHWAQGTPLLKAA